jgi:hypothetical protein
MLLRVVMVWVAGLLTIVPYGTYYLLFRAQPHEYAFLITLVLFWIFGFWGVVGPVLAVVRVRRVFRAIESAQSPGKLMEVLSSQETRDVAIDLIASENKIPRFLAVRVYRMLANRLSAVAGGTPDTSLRGSGVDPDGPLP